MSSRFKRIETNENKQRAAHCDLTEPRKRYSHRKSKGGNLKIPEVENFDLV